MRFLSYLVVTLLLGSVFLALPVDAAQRSFKDVLGHEVSIRFPPRRIVSLTPSVTEMLFAIGQDQSIVGVTRYCNFPAKAKTRVRVGGYYDPSLEKIVALDPDLVILAADGYNKHAADKLIEMGIACFVVDPSNVPAIIHTMELLARVTGIEKEAEPRIAKLHDRWKVVDERVKLIPPEQRVHVFYALDARDLWTTGTGTFLHDLLQHAGAVNIAAEQGKGWFQFSMETLFLANPDFIVTGRNANQKHEDVLKEWESRKSLPAVTAGKICAVDNDSLSRPGPRSIDVLEQLLLTFYRIDLRAEPSAHPDALEP